MHRFICGGGYMINRYYGYILSPIGKVEVCTNDSYVLKVSFVEEEQTTLSKPEILIKALRQLKEYFSGERKQFELDFELEGTEFQKRAWTVLMDIPYGETITYKEMAIRLGNENAARAVGGANNKNKIAIFIPCHRVIGSNKKLVGYAGGLDKKEWLIKHEKNEG